MKNIDFFYRFYKLILLDYICEKNSLPLFFERIPRFQLYFLDKGSSFPVYEGNGGVNLYWGKYNSPMPMISYTEVKFLEAEIKARKGDITGVKTALQEAIMVNMNQVGADIVQAQTYINNYAVLSGNMEAQIQKIIEEKYVALFVQGAIESWTDYRRTGYPALTPNPNGVNNDFNPSGVIPRRCPYPSNESVVNNDNLQKAIARQGNKTNNLDSELWAFE